MTNITFSPKAWDDYLYWQMRDKKVLQRINALLQDIQRNGMAHGIGKPEPLKQHKAWSRRIDDVHRLIYRYDEHQNLQVIQCRGHYGDH